MTLSSFYDLTIRIGEATSEGYSLDATSAGLEGTYRANLPSKEAAELIAKASPLSQDPLPPQELQELGRLLFEAVIRGSLRDAYRILEGRYAERLSFRLVLAIQPRELLRLPWEAMYDPLHNNFLSLRDRTHILRQVDKQPEGGSMLSSAGAAAGAPGYTNIVIAIANASGQPPFDTHRERAFIEDALYDLNRAGKLTRRFIRGEQGEMKQELADTPDVFHFIGHGGIDRNGVPGLYLEDTHGDAIFETAGALENQYFTPPPGSSGRVRLVVLSACQTSETPKTEGHNSLAQVIARQVDAVVAMQYPILLENVTAFNRYLYQGLASGASLETAVNSARRAIASDKPRGGRDWIAPVLVAQTLSPTRLLQLFRQNPFKGPLFYDIEDYTRFYGRERNMEELLSLYRDHAVVVLKGKTGCGKTSLLKAGLMARLQGEQRLIYLSLSEKLEQELRLEIDNYLSQERRNPLPAGNLAELTAHFPDDVAIIIDRLEGVEHLGEEINRIVRALAVWAGDPAHPQSRKRLVLATRLTEEGDEPDLLASIAPEPGTPRLKLEMLDWEQAERCIDAATLNTPVTFPSETITAILSGLHYDHPENRNMMALQVVCSALFLHTQQRGRDAASPELLADLGGVEGILERDFKIASRLNKAIYTRGEAARHILAQFVSSNRTSMRPRSWKELLLRSGLEERELRQILDQLQEDGILHPEQRPGEERYELAHETLVRQVTWLDDAEIELRKLEEIVESAGWLVPLRSVNGGLEDLDPRRDEVRLTDNQQALLLRSALEADHEIKYWFGRVEGAVQGLAVLVNDYLSLEAKVRACPFLGILGGVEDQGAEGVARRAQKKLLKWACSGESPPLCAAASLALAPLADQELVKSQFGDRRESLSHGEIEALARMHDAHPLPLKVLDGTTKRRVWGAIIRLNTLEILTSLARAATAGAVGLGLAASWIYAQVYTGRSRPAGLLILELALVGLLGFILALPGALLAPLGRDLSSLLNGGRRSFPAALGAVAGSALGMGLTVFLIAALAEYSNPNLVRLAKYALSGELLGIVAALPWLIPAFYPTKSGWIVTLAGVSTAVAFLVITTMIPGWWPETSFALTLDPRYGAVTRIIAGSLIGLGSALGLAWGRLHLVSSHPSAKTLGLRRQRSVR